MIRLLIFLGLVYVGYRVVKSWVLTHLFGGQIPSGGRSGEINDVMVQDPYCGVYFSRNEGVSLRIGDRELFFCSPECRDRYIDEKKKT